MCTSRAINFNELGMSRINNKENDKNVVFFLIPTLDTFQNQQLTVDEQGLGQKLSSECFLQPDLR